MNLGAKRNLRNLSRTSEKYTFKGIKFAGIDMLTATELNDEKLSKKNDKVHCLITNAGKITPSVSFRRPSISITSANYFFDECSCGKENNPVESLRITLKTSENVLENILGNTTRQNERSISNTKDKKMDFER